VSHPLPTEPWRVVLGPRWTEDGLRQPGWILLPLRLFLGVTFTFAALQKLANPAYFDASNSISIQAQMHTFVHGSPIGPIISALLPIAGFLGLLIALGELAVGLAALFGVWMRLAAVGGGLLALSFFLTVSWATTPYYYGSDIVFLFAWTPFALMGAGDVLSVDGIIRDRVRREAARSRRAPSAREIDRRTILLTARSAAALGALAAVSGGLAAGVGRAVSSTPASSAATVTPPATKSRRRTARHHAKHQQASQPTQGPTQAAPPSGHLIAHRGQVPVGRALQFTDPSSGRVAYLLHPDSATYLAFSAVCTHAGCTVNFVSDSQGFACPCHGATYSAQTGDVTGGPAPNALAHIPITVSNGDVYAT
jgi:thiosulfate dehydrogenase [quinone] large subunit